MQHHTRPDLPTPVESFPTDPTGLPKAGRPALLELAHGDTLDLQVGPVAKRLGDTTVRMLGYNQCRSVSLVCRGRRPRQRRAWSASARCGGGRA